MNSEKKVTDSDISAKKNEFERILGHKFNTEKFNEDAQFRKNENLSLNSMSIGTYKKEDDKNNGEQSYPVTYTNGMYSAIGPDGNKIQHKDNYEFNRLMAQAFKKDAEKKRHRT